MHTAATTIADFLTAAAAKRPTPGGGAVAALAGALSAAMAEMVLNYSVDKKSLAAHAASNKAWVWEMSRFRDLLTDCVADDQAAFERLTDARKRGEDVTSLVEDAIAVPREVGETALEILRGAVAVAAQTNTFLASDLAVCGDLAMATVRAAVHNIKANLPDVGPDRRQALHAECHRMLAIGVERVNALTAAIERAKGAA